jgi:pimeloyl-ACP methyl ester carboxylesterase
MIMEKIITYDNLRSFAYSNDRLIQGPIRGIVVHFCGLGNMVRHDIDPGDAREYAAQNILFVIPYNNPWCWMNSQAVRYTDEIIQVLCDHYSLGSDVKIVSVGQSMGGLSCLVYSRYARITPVACVADCPVCDLSYHFTEREDLPRTLYSAFGSYDGTLDEALRSASPLHLVPEMPRISYTIFHSQEDRLVNIHGHSEAFAAAMEENHHQIQLIRVPHRDHCDLSAAAQVEYRRIILSAFD